MNVDAATRSPPSSAELSTVVRLVRARRAVLVNVGHGRDPASVASAGAFVELWRAGGGEIGEVVSWPGTAASWLRPAARLTSGSPDVWVVADRPEGWVGIGRRLAALDGWHADRTVAFARLADPLLPGLAGVDCTDGLSGATETGGTWCFRDNTLIENPRGIRR